MYKTPAVEEDSSPIGPNGSSDFYRQQSQYISMLSPGFLSSGAGSGVASGVFSSGLSSGGSRPKPRINATSSPTSTSSPSKMAAYLQSQHEEMEAKIERDRALYSINKDVEARVRRELEESKVMT